MYTLNAPPEKTGTSFFEIVAMLGVVAGIVWFLTKYYKHGKSLQRDEVIDL